MENEWYNELQESIEQNEIMAEFNQNVNDSLIIMLALKEAGYKDADFDRIITRMKSLDLSVNEAIIKIKNKKR
jgi:hypothetical protein